MRVISILILSLTLILLIANPVLADAGEARHEEKEVDGYKVKLTFVEGDVQIGHNEINIQVNDPQGQLVTNASVTVIAELYEESPTDTTGAGNGGMDMGGAQNSAGPAEKPIETTKVELKAGPTAGEFEGEVDLSEAGHWMITAVIKLEQMEKSVEFEVELKKSGPNWYVLSGFFGLILAFVIGGLITKRKSNSVPVVEEVK